MRGIYFEVFWMVIDVDVLVLISSVTESFNNLEGLFEHDSINNVVDWQR